MPSIRVTEKGAEQDADAIQLSDGRKLPLQEGLEMHQVPDEDTESLVGKGFAETFVPNIEDLSEEREAEPITGAQNRKLHALYNRLDFDEQEKREFLGKYNVQHTDELSKEKAIGAIDDLESRFVREEAEEGEVAKPESMRLPPGQAGQKAALKMEKRDDKQIASEVAQIPEKAVEDWFYQFTQTTEDGKTYTVTGLSYAGVMALMRKQENIDVEILENVEKEDHYKVKVRAVDRARNITFERIKRQPKKMTKKDGTREDDEFADVKAESKAIKKALQAVLSPRVVVRAYEKWQEARR